MNALLRTRGRRLLAGFPRWIAHTGSVALWLLLSSASCKAQDTSSGQRVSPHAALTRGTPITYSVAVERVAAAVVTIRSERRARASSHHPFFDDPAFRDFFGAPFEGATPQPQIEHGLGSGVLVGDKGYVLTNQHVVDGAQEIEIELNDQRTFPARLVGADPPSDLAVLQIDGKGLPALVLGNSDQVQVGDVVLAIGNPLGVGQTVTAGIISAKGRSTGLSDGSFEDFLQTDAPINQGNSGGPLINTAGECIGINSQILSPTGGNIGIGFAIPSNMAHDVMQQLVTTGHVRRGQLGVGIQPVTPEIAQSLNLSDVRGAIVNGVVPGSGGDRAGIHRGDVIVEFEGQPVTDSNVLRNRISSTAPGKTIALALLRDGRRQQVHATLGEFTTEAPSSARPASLRKESGPEMSVVPVTPELAAQLGLDPRTQGLVVTEVGPAGLAADAGIQPGDVIQQIDRRAVRSAAELTQVLHSGQRPALLLLNRGGQTFFVTLSRG